MTYIVDIEELLLSTRSFLKANLSSFINQINAEKSDALNIADIPQDDDHFLLYGEMFELPNNTFVKVEVEDITVEGENNRRIERIPILVRVGLFMDNTQNTYRQILRYIRCLADCMQKFEYSSVNLSDIQMTTVFPYSFDPENNGSMLWVGGVRCIVSIG